MGGVVCSILKDAERKNVAMLENRVRNKTCRMAVLLLSQIYHKMPNCYFTSSDFKLSHTKL